MSGQVNFGKSSSSPAEEDGRRSAALKRRSGGDNVLAPGVDQSTGDTTGPGVKLEGVPSVLSSSTTRTDHGPVGKLPRLDLNDVARVGDDAFPSAGVVGPSSDAAEGTHPSSASSSPVPSGHEVNQCVAQWHAIQLQQQYVQITAQLAIMQSLEDQERLAQQQQQQAAQQEKQPQQSRELDETNVYVAHLPGDMTHEEFVTLMSRFGTVVSSRVLIGDRWQKKGVRGVGFARMGSEQEALVAIRGLNALCLPGSDINLHARLAFKTTRKTRQDEERVAGSGASASFDPMLQARLGANYGSSAAAGGRMPEGVDVGLGVGRDLYAAAVIPDYTAFAAWPGHGARGDVGIGTGQLSTQPSAGAGYALDSLVSDSAWALAPLSPRSAVAAMAQMRTQTPTPGTTAGELEGGDGGEYRLEGAGAAVDPGVYDPFPWSQ